MEKKDLLGYGVLFLGVALLIFTFFSAFSFLRGDLSLVGSTDLLKAFGEVLGPLVKATIHVMYLGIMGWVGSIMTMRGVQVVTGLRKEEKAAKQEVTPDKQGSADQTARSP